MKGLAKPKVTASATKAVGSSIAAPNLNAVPVNPSVDNFYLLLENLIFFV